MCKSLCVSLASKKGVSSVVLLCEGKLIQKSVTKITNTEVLDSSYLCLISTFISALRQVRQYIGDNTDIDKVVFEVNNSTFIKWVYNSFSKDQYQEFFIQALELLNEIPIQYTFSYSKKPIATKYIDNGVDKVKLSGLLED